MILRILFQNKKSTHFIETQQRMNKVGNVLKNLKLKLFVNDELGHENDFFVVVLFLWEIQYGGQ